jgi:hypothetical protein
MKQFNAIDFLRALVDDVASSEREGKQFAADPSILGPLLLSVQQELTALTLRYDALNEGLWQVHKSDDSNWRVYSAAVSLEVLDGQGDGSDSPEEGCETKRDYVERPWTEEENADFEEFCETIDVPPTDPELAAAMEDGDLDFFNNDIWTGLKLCRA